MQYVAAWEAFLTRVACAVQTSVIQIVLIMLMVAFLLSFVVFDSIPKLRLFFRLRRQKKNLKRMKKWVRLMPYALVALLRQAYFLLPHFLQQALTSCVVMHVGRHRSMMQKKVKGTMAVSSAASKFKAKLKSRPPRPLPLPGVASGALDSSNDSFHFTRVLGCE